MCTGALYNAHPLPINFNAIGASYHSQGDFAMQINDYVYFLSVKQAMEIAEKHRNDADWDIFSDPEAIAKGMNNLMEKAS